MQDVAAHAGVSRALVSIVFRGAPGASESTRARVLSAAADLGYQPDRRASRLGRSRTRMIGVVFDFAGDFHGQVIDGLYAAAAADGYEIVLSPSTPRRNEAAAVEALVAERCEAMILIGPRLPARSIVELAAEVPVVSLLREIRSPRVDVVRTDERLGMELLIGHLQSLGHSSILHVDGGPAAGAGPRRRAFTRAMTDHGLAASTTPGGPSEEAGAAAADAFLETSGRTRPTAIAAFNDRCALGILHRLRERGVSNPGTLALTGFDDIPVAASAHIQLTTVRQDADEIARQAVTRLRTRLEDGGDPGVTILIPPSLVVRSTTGT